MDHDHGVGQAEALALRAARQQHGSHGSGHAHADGGDVGLDEVHGVQDGKTGIDLAAGRVNVERDVLLGILALEMQQLRDDQVGRHRVDLLAQEDDAVVEQTGIDVVAALAAGRLFDDVGHERGINPIHGQSPFAIFRIYARTVHARRHARGTMHRTRQFRSPGMIPNKGQLLLGVSLRVLVNLGHDGVVDQPVNGLGATDGVADGGHTALGQERGLGGLGS